jgi:hypothetical protein
MVNMEYQIPQMMCCNVRPVMQIARHATMHQQIALHVTQHFFSIVISALLIAHHKLYLLIQILLIERVIPAERIV